MPNIPTIEPTSFTAGDTIAWLISLSDYPATDSWVLKYRLINAAGKIDIISSASGADHAINVTAATSAGYAAGTYDWQSYVEKGTERYTIKTGRLQILPNLAAQAAGYDNRSQPRRILEALLTAYESASGSRGFVQEYSINGRTMRFNNKADWIKEINFWKAEVAAEERATRINAGLGAGNKLLVRFNR